MAQPQELPACRGQHTGLYGNPPYLSQLIALHLSEARLAHHTRPKPSGKKRQAHTFGARLPPCPGVLGLVIPGPQSLRLL